MEKSIEVIQPTDQRHWLELRSKDITSTDVAALFGCSPYCTEFELWHRKKESLIIELEQDDRMKWGTRLESSIAAGIAEDHGWTIRKMTEYMRDPIARMGSSFDFSILRKETGESAALLEVKNVDSFVYQNGWLVDGEHIEAPAHIELQVQHQLAVTGLEKAYIGALVGGNRVILIERARDLHVIDAIRAKVKSFWLSIEKGIQPSPDFSKDVEFINKLYSFSEKGKTLYAVENQNLEDLAREYQDLAEREKNIKKKKDEVKAKILMSIGDSEKAIGKLFTISAGTVGPAKVTFDRGAYRNFRVIWKKEA